jgi:hypothetical protein
MSNRFWTRSNQVREVQGEVPRTSSRAPYNHFAFCNFINSNLIPLQLHKLLHYMSYMLSTIFERDQSKFARD